MIDLVNMLLCCGDVGGKRVIGWMMRWSAVDFETPDRTLFILQFERGRALFYQNLASSIPSYYQYPKAKFISEDRSHLAHAPECHDDRSHGPRSQITHVVT